MYEKFIFNKETLNSERVAMAPGEPGVCSVAVMKPIGSPASAGPRKYETPRESNRPSHIFYKHAAPAGAENISLSYTFLFKDKI
ncbi:hypothetical protein NIASO_03535 [Niabella soli DSM 19437]|uniref:Uncharacterized protein n=1 Tax=Niabella soli DSM 19437 TaxID=929713 RepID=W0F776_9BACT|nr:hypothetical protein NIASO_03535 [Niabella soli DSM 19437]